MTQTELSKLLPSMPNVEMSGPIGRQVSEGLELSRTYRGYVWLNWFVNGMPKTWALFAIGSIEGLTPEPFQPLP